MALRLPARVLILACAAWAGACSSSRGETRPAPREVAAAPARAPRRPGSALRDQPEPAPLVDDVTIEGVLGTLDPDEIQPTFELRWGEIVACQRAQARRLPYLGGMVSLTVRVGAGGEVLRTHVTRSDLGSYAIERCVVDVVRGMVFGRPHGGAEAEFTYDVPLPARTPPPQEWTPERIADELRRHRKEVAACRALGRFPRDGVKLTLFVSVGGRVTSAGLAADEPLDDAFAACIAERAVTWRLPDPLGRVARVTVPVK